MNCIFCRTEVQIKGKVGRQDTCPKCKRDLRCCKQCEFYDPDAYNDCREVSAERILDKERANFCDYYIPAGTKGKGRSGSSNKTKDAREALEALFRKK